MGHTDNSRTDFGLRGPIALGAAALAALGVLGGVGAFAGSPRPGEPAPQQISVSAVATTTTVGVQPGSAATLPGRTMGPDDSAGSELTADEQKLMGLLPAGYGPDSCHAVTKGPPKAVATIDCGNNSSPGGPALARYLLYANAKDLAASFHDSTLATVTVTPCPNGEKSPNTWGYGSDPTVAGSVVCATDPGNSNSPTLAWTVNATLYQAVVEGPDLEGLYKWWQEQPLGTTQGRTARP